MSEEEEEEYSRGKHAIRHLERTSNETDNGSPDRPNDPRSVFPIGDALITPPIQKYRRTHRRIDSWHVSLSPSLSFSSLGDCLGKKDTRRKRAIFFFKGKTRDVVMDRPKITTVERQRGRRV